MNILKTSSWTWWQMGLIKWSILLVGIGVGAHWSAFFGPYALKLVIVGVIVGLYPAILWFKQ